MRFLMYSDIVVVIVPLLLLLLIFPPPSKTTHTKEEYILQRISSPKRDDVVVGVVGIVGGGSSSTNKSHRRGEIINGTSMDHQNEHDNDNDDDDTTRMSRRMILRRRSVYNDKRDIIGSSADSSEILHQNPNQNKLKKLRLNKKPIESLLAADEEDNDEDNDNDGNDNDDNDDDDETLSIDTSSSSENDHHRSLLAGFGDNPDSGGIEKNSKNIKIELEDKSDGGGVSGGAAILDEFVTGKIHSADNGVTLPFFLTEPESAFVVKNRPAILKCKAAHALQLHFKCSGSSQPPPSTHDKHVDPHTGVFLEEVTATIDRDLVDEYFGKGAFKCECHAWSSRGVVKSQSATINISYIRKNFVTSPTSLRVELGSRAELFCEPPIGFPEPNITWYKNNVPINVDGNHGITIGASSKTLTFPQVSLQDMANYSCSAENIANKRISESAVLIVYVNGGWSPWGPWKDCKCSGNAIQGRKRTRVCNNPVPINGGSQCSGAQIQKSADCLVCSDETQIVSPDSFDAFSNKRLGRWTAWSDWSSCSIECIQIRRRKCVTNDVDDNILLTVSSATNTATVTNLPCVGKDFQTAECRGEHCPIGRDDFDWTLYLGLAFITAVCFAFGTALICCARRVGVGANPHYNMARRVMDSEYMPGVDKKEMRMHIEAANISYDYANPDHRYLPNDHINSCAISEHHYDVPNLSANYTNPIDELNGDYLTDTPDTSTADTSNSTYEAMVKQPSTATGIKGTAYELLSSYGGSLCLYGGEILLHVPELAIGKSIKKHVVLMILQDDSGRISLPSSVDSLLICSTVVYCAPRDYTFLKPVILKIPHCLVNMENWNVSIYNADSEHDELNVNWRKIIQVGEETINTPCFVHIERTHVYIMTEHLGRFVVVAEPKGNTTMMMNEIHPSSIRMKLIAFSQQTPTSSNTSLRIYVVKDFPNSKDICAGIETQLGGTYMGQSEVFIFYLNNCHLNIRVRIIMMESTSSCDSNGDHAELLEHVIPYNHILNNSSILHCEFSIKRSSDQLLSAIVEFAQVGGQAYNSFSIPNGGGGSTNHVYDSTSIEHHRNTLVSIDRQGKYISSDTVATGTGTAGAMGLHLPRVTKRMLCAALDPPRADERDWRLLAKLINTDRYIAYFATKPSPTEQILNLWECRAQYTSHTIAELLMILKDMDRQDVLGIISETTGPLWI